MPDLYAYTDGACSGNPGPGGWGVLMIAKEGSKIIKTKNLVELPKLLITKWN